jgi:hypothetical protein
VLNVVIFWDMAPRTDVSEEYITSIFRIENQPSKKPARSRWLGRTLHNEVLNAVTFWDMAQ